MRPEQVWRFPRRTDGCSGQNDARVADGNKEKVEIEKNFHCLFKPADWPGDPRAAWLTTHNLSSDSSFTPDCPFPQTSCPSSVHILYRLTMNSRLIAGIVTFPYTKNEICNYPVTNSRTHQPRNLFPLNTLFII